MNGFARWVVGVAALECAACQAPRPKEDARAEILRLDAEWSRDAKEGKNVDRIVSYWADDAVVMPPGSPPIVGKAAIRDFVVNSLKTPGFSIVWNATDVTLPEDGKLAYAIETNRVTLTGVDGKPLVIDGKAVTVWRHEPVYQSIGELAPILGLRYWGSRGRLFSISCK